MIHEAYQFLMLKKRKLSGRTMTENWSKVGSKSKVYFSDFFLKQEFYRIINKYNLNFPDKKLCGLKNENRKNNGII